MTDNDKKRQTENLMAAAAALGEVTSLLVRSREHARYAIPDIEWLLVPAIVNRQFLIVRSQTTGAPVPLPGACLLWASLSPEIDGQYRATPGLRLKLTAEQRRSGSHIWITDLIGDRKLLNDALNRLRANSFKGQTISFFNGEDPTRTSVVDVMPN